MFGDWDIMTNKKKIQELIQQTNIGDTVWFISTDSGIKFTHADMISEMYQKRFGHKLMIIILDGDLTKVLKVTNVTS